MNKFAKAMAVAVALLISLGAQAKTVKPPKDGWVVINAETAKSGTKHYESAVKYNKGKPVFVYRCDANISQYLTRSTTYDFVNPEGKLYGVISFDDPNVKVYVDGYEYRKYGSTNSLNSKVVGEYYTGMRDFKEVLKRAKEGRTVFVKIGDQVIDISDKDGVASFCI